VLAWAQQAGFTGGLFHADLRECDPAEALAGFLRALGEGVPSTVPARSARFRSVVAGRQVLLVLDNADSAEQVRPLLPGSELTVVLSRDALDDLVVRDGAGRLWLGGLSDEEAFDLVVAVAGWDEVESGRDAVDRLLTQADGMPLALRAGAVRLGEPVRRPRHWAKVAVALALVAGVLGLSDVIDKTTLHAVVATRGGQLTALSLLVLAGCLAVLRPISGLGRRHSQAAALCLLGTGLTVAIATAGRTPDGPPALVDTLHLLGVVVWAVVLGVAVPTVPRVRVGYLIAVPVAVTGSWAVFGRLAVYGTATNMTYGYLLVAAAAMSFAVVGAPVRPPVPAGRRHTAVAVGILLVISVLAAILGPRARHRAYDPVVYVQHIESHAVAAETGADPVRLIVEAGCEASPCSSPPV
jgi:hypothetical protein